MDFKQPGAQVYVPDGLADDAALARTTHLAIGAHQDDLEIMAAHGILTCYQQDNLWYTGVVVTDGSGSPRAGIYADYTDEEMQQVRALEQKKAAFLGDFGAQVLLDYPSRAVKDPRNTGVVNDLVQLLQVTSPQTVYTHNLADKHPTHIGVAVKVIQALRSLPDEQRPSQVYGCEVWRDLDWLLDQDKVVFDVSGQEGLQMALLGVFDSQVSGGKRYDLATMGRRRAHATYHASHDTDAATGLTFGMDLTPLIENPALDIADFVSSHIDRFKADVIQQIQQNLNAS
ncbi:MAG: PIG-L family deacetylase [Chloroflexi bacterium]|nr:PIG-L family deacetylase [Chloroflexota bacterium]